MAKHVPGNTSQKKGDVRVLIAGRNSDLGKIRMNLLGKQWIKLAWGCARQV